jgi:hypothetical protein
MPEGRGATRLVASAIEDPTNSVLRADYLRNVETRSPVGIDINRVGDISTFNSSGEIKS